MAKLTFSGACTGGDGVRLTDNADNTTLIAGLRLLDVQPERAMATTSVRTCVVVEGEHEPPTLEHIFGVLVRDFVKHDPSRGALASASRGKAHTVP